MSALTTKTFDKVVANLGWPNVVLPRPVYDGDTAYAQSTILDKRELHSRPEQGILHVLTEGSNQNGELVCRFERSFLVKRKVSVPMPRPAINGGHNERLRCRISI